MTRIVFWVFMINREMVDILICVFNFLISLLSAYISINVRNHLLPTYTACFAGILLSILWAYTVKNTQLTILQASALFSTICEIGYFTGFIMMGGNINIVNYLGIFLLILGILLVHY